ncbi:TetR/AcrR family transcriptional regulator [Kiloniella sp.]|uniref:TetR/AcrR family transcriptional regulator n=1 Tax=Kiloniella sp. TaxID=1938587 RepID=UPI003B020216
MKDSVKQTREQLNKAKKEAISKAAMSLLIEGGGENLSMRKVAELAGISLGNLQYHYKTKEDLLTALLNGFLDQYLNENWLQTSSKQVPNDEQLERMFWDILTHDSFDDCSIVFKELWALAQRNEEIENALMSYYKKTHSFLCDTIGQLHEPMDDHKISRVVDVLIPFFEGYCITKKALSSDPAQLARDLSRITNSYLREEINDNSK